MQRIFEARGLPLVDAENVAEIDADGIDDQIHLLGADFQVTYYRIVHLIGYAGPVRVPVLRLRRPLITYVPNQIGSMIFAEQRRAGVPLLAN